MAIRGVPETNPASKGNGGDLAIESEVGHA